MLIEIFCYLRRYPNVAVRLCLFLVMVMLTGMPLPALAKLSGEVDWLYSNYRSEVDGEKDHNTSSFSQRYSVLWEKNGFVGDQRLGKYNLLLGYEWTALDTSSNENQDIEIDGGKIIYSGELEIAPGAIPFRLSLFSFDKQRAADQRVSVGTIINDSVPIGWRSLEQIESGITMVAGIRNGTYLGAYRQILSTLPRLFLDYRQVLYRDTDGIEKIHNLTRDLAFVSLNKKDNWFHYRAHEYRNYIDSADNFSSQTFLLGTIDQTLKRQWINMTNWLKISVDGSVRLEESEPTQLAFKDPVTYRVNLFAQAAYDKTRVNSYNHFYRETTSDSISKELELPWYANGWLDANRSWSLYLNKYSYQEETFVAQPMFSIPDEEGEYFAASLSSGHRQLSQFDLKLELESNRQGPKETHAVRARLEKYKKSIDGKKPWILGYTVAYFDKSSDLESAESVNESLEQELYGSTQLILSPRNTLEIKQNFRYSTAVITESTARFIYSKRAGKTFDGALESASTRGQFATESWLSLDSKFGSKLTNRVLLTNLMYFGGSTDRKEISLEDVLSYRSSRWFLQTTNGIYTGDNLASASVGSGGARNLVIESRRPQRTSNSDNYILAHSSRLNYSPTRNFKTLVLLNFSLTDTEDGNVYQSYFSARNEYSFFTLTGRLRNVAQLYQEVEYANYRDDYSTASYFSALLGAGYYPRSFLRFGGEIGYEANEPQGSDTVSFSVLAALDYTKLSCELRYSYGTGSYFTSPEVNRTEHLLQAKVRKTF